MSASTIAPPQYKDVLKKRNGTTRDIIKEVLAANKEPLHRQTAAFARQFSRDYDGMGALWQWVKTNIEYLEDPMGVQWIREPARLFADGQGDCKSFTGFMCAIFKNLKLDYTIRFVTYSRSNSYVTHVYPLVFLPDGREVAMDAVWKAFDRQKEPMYLTTDFKFTTDMNIYRLSGIGADNDADIAARLNNMAQNAVTVTSDLVTVGTDITTMTEREAIAFFTGQTVTGIGANNAAFTLPTIGIEGIGKNGAGKAKVKAVIKKAGTVIKDAAKKLINSIFKDQIPKMGPFFLSLFVAKTKNPKLQKIKAKQEKFIGWLAKITGTSPAVVLASLTSGIQKKYGLSPDKVVALAAQGQMPTGVQGVDGIGVIDDAIDIVFKVIAKLIAFFKKNKSEVPALSTADGFDPVLVHEEHADPTTPPIKTVDPSVLMEKNTKSNTSGGNVADDDSADAPSSTTIKPASMNDSGVVKKKKAAASGESKTMLYVGAAVVALGVVYVASQKKGVGRIHSSGKTLCAKGTRSTTLGRGACSFNGGKAKRGSQGRLAL